MRQTVALIGLILLSVHFTYAADQQTVHPKLVLDHIKLLKAQEVSGDELYLDLSLYKPKQKKVFQRIPKAPIYWPSTSLAQIKDVPIWSDDLKKGEEVNLILALMERDASLLNPDDLIGSVRIKLKNVKGQLTSQWSIPNRVNGPTTLAGEKGPIQEIELFDGQIRYKIYLYLTYN